MTNPGELQPQSLIRRFRDGDAEAFRVLFEEHAEVLRARVRRLLRGDLARKLSVADVLQEARLAAFDGRGTFEGSDPEAFRNWALGIVENKARRVLRHFARQRRDVDREVSRGRRAETGQFRGRGASPSLLLAAAERSEQVRRTLAALPDEQREVLRLVHEERLALREVAARLGCSYEAAKKRHARALLGFANAWKRGGGDGHG